MPRGKKKSKQVKTLPAVKAVNPATAPTRKKRRTKAQVKAILDQVAALRAKGTGLGSALKELKISQANYYYWTKHHGATGSVTKEAEVKPLMETSSAKGATKAEKMRAVVEEIAALKASGITLDKAIKQKGLTVTNYYYWVNRLKKLGNGVANKAKPGRPVGVGKAGDVTALLDAMKGNRAEREKLDAEWRELLRRLGAER